MIFFKVISKRYKKDSVVTTTNKGFDAWGDIFADSILSLAIIDRIAHHSTIITIKGPSFRTKELKLGGEEKKQ